jgi:gliding motility-associated-like protein
LNPFCKFETVRRGIIFIILILLGTYTHAQRRFIKQNSSVDFGANIRIVPVIDQGWIVMSMDSLRLARYDKCGKTLWSIRLNIANTHPSLCDIICLKNTNLLILSRILPGLRYGSLLTCVDTSGHIVWSKSYEDPAYDQFSYNLGEDNFGHIYMFANVSQVGANSYNMLMKLDMNGNALWTKFYDHGGTYGGSIVTLDNGNLFRTGNVFVKTDSSGSVEWTTSVTSANSYHYTSPVEVTDGYIFTKYRSTSRANIFYKISKQGMIMTAKICNYTGDYPRLKVSKIGTLVGIFNPNSNPTVVELDKDLNVLRQGSVKFSGLSLRADDFCFSGGDVVIAGRTGTSHMFYAKLDDLFRSSCDTTLPLMTMSPEQAWQNGYPTNVTQYAFTQVGRNYHSAFITDDELTLCTVPLQLELGPDTLMCMVSTFTIRNNLVGLFDEYLWSTGSTNPYLIINQPGQYWVQAKQYCEDSTFLDTVTVGFDTVPGLNVSDILVCVDSSVTLHAPYCNCTYEWNTGDKTDSLRIISPGLYSVKIENKNFCSRTDVVDVGYTSCDCDLYLPNTFTPNNDGINEVFKPVYHCEMSDYELKIYNRMGKLVFSTNDPNTGWNGYYRSSNGIEDIYNYSLQYNPLIRGVKTELKKVNGMVALIY